MISSSSDLTRRQLNIPNFWVIGIVFLCIIAWVVTIVTMSDMDYGPGTHLHDFSIFVTGWLLMLIAMMLPSEIVYTRTYSQLLLNTPKTKQISNVLSFIAGYALVWLMFGVIAFQLDGLMRTYLNIKWLDTGHMLAGSVLVLAGIYQVSSLKHWCLDHCRSPLSFFMKHWKMGSFGATSMGIKHGVVCVACCWALMTVMFAVGAMNLIWMAILTLVMFTEKVFLFGNKLTLTIAIFLVGIGIWMFISPDSVPLIKDPTLFEHSHHKH